MNISVRLLGTGGCNGCAHQKKVYEIRIREYTFRLCERCQGHLLNQIDRVKDVSCHHCDTLNHEIARLRRWVKVILTAADNANNQIGPEVPAEVFAEICGDNNAPL